jgi:hypothetical protein
VDSSLVVSVGAATLSGRKNPVELLTGFRIYLGDLACEMHYQPVSIELALGGFLSARAYQLVLVYGPFAPLRAKYATVAMENNQLEGLPRRLSGAVLV